MKKIKYLLLQSISKDGTPVTLEVTVDHSEENLEIAKKEAYKGDYVIVDMETEN